jgi:hypothetical protein
MKQSKKLKKKRKNFLKELLKNKLGKLAPKANGEPTSSYQEPK